ncbi:HNH endonuclease [Lachnospiraceae bacterium HCP1S3_A8]
MVETTLYILAPGKTIASNLQVLCSKCNGSKSNRI